MREFIKHNHPIVAFPPAAAPLGTEDYVSMKGHDLLTIILIVDNGTTVTGSVVTLKQATAVDGTGEKALAFTEMFANEDVGANDTLVKTTVSSNTFTTDTTNAKNLLYVIQVKAADLDQDNDFDCARVDVTDPTNAVIGGVYILSRQRYSTGGTPVLSGVTD